MRASGWGENVKFSRLWQPDKPAFWLVLLLNLLSTVLAWVVQAYTLPPMAQVVVLVFAVGNALLGGFFTWQLLKNPPVPKS